MEDIYIRGTCFQMCSDREINFREKNGLLHPLEIYSGCKGEVKADVNKTVKMYTRSAAGKTKTSPEDLRPSAVLLKTMNYLVREIVTDSKYPWVYIYDFVNDRIQAIRQDITIQKIEDKNAVEIIEKCVRFYILASYLLCEEPQAKFDKHLNNQQLSICLERLFCFYETFQSENLCEFIAINCSKNLLNIDSFYLFMTAFADYMKDPIVNSSIVICLAFLEGNYIKFFRYCKKLPFIILLSFFQYFSFVRNRALISMCTSFSSNTCKFPLSVLCVWLAVSEKKHLHELCQKCNIKIEDENVLFNKKHLVLVTNSDQFYQEEFIHRKLQNTSLYKLINGT